MTLTLKDTEIDGRLLQKLLALPYDLEIRDGGQHFVLTPRGHLGWTWEELCARPVFGEEFNGWKVETNSQNQVLMSPSPHAEHQGLGSQILLLLARLMDSGKPVYETGVKTRNGTRIPDVMWASDERWKKRGRRASFTLAPEICVEVLSPGNKSAEIEEKMRLYLEAGALEFWRCDRNGKMAFLDADGTLPRSRLCPKFPTRLDPFA